MVRYSDELIDEIRNNNDIVEVLDIIGTKRGCLERGGIVSYEKVYNIILQDIKNNAFGNITLDRKEA